MMSNNRNRRRNRIIPNDSLMVSNATTGPRDQTQFPREDLLRRQGSWLLTQTPPRSIGNHITWVSGRSESTVTLSTSAPVENNFSFAATDIPQLSGLLGYFDQYCIYSVLVAVNFNYNGTTPGALGTMVTAIDYDNVTNLGTFNAIESYQSAVVTKVTPMVSLVRLIKPAVATALYSGASFNNFGILRAWVDSASSAAPHYGFRSFFISTSSTTVVATFDKTYVIGFRNNV